MKSNPVVAKIFLWPDTYKCCSWLLPMMVSPLLLDLKPNHPRKSIKSKESQRMKLSTCWNLMIMAMMSEMIKYKGIGQIAWKERGFLLE